MPSEAALPQLATLPRSLPGRTLPGGSAGFSQFSRDRLKAALQAGNPVSLHLAAIPSPEISVLA